MYSIYNLYRVNIMHIFLIGPILSYIGYYKNNTNYNIKLIFIGITFMLPFIVRLPNINRLYFQHNLINLIHWTIILIFLLYISYNFYFNNNIHNNLYNILFITGIITIISHIYLIYNKYITNKNTKNIQNNLHKH